MNRKSEGAPILTANEARQSKRTGMIRVLIAGLMLACIAAVCLWLYFGSLPVAP